MTATAATALPRELPTPCYWDPEATLYQGEALSVLHGLPDASADALISDPPYSSGGKHSRDRNTVALPAIVPKRERVH